MTSWSYESIRDQLGTQSVRKLHKLAAVGAAGVAATGGLVLGGTTTPAGATLPASGNMFKMGVTTGIDGSFQAGWNAVERSLGPSTFTTEGCTDGTKFSNLITTIHNDIADHRQVVAGIPITNGVRCGGPGVGLTHWSTKVKNVVTSVEKDTGWQRYFGGVTLDEEGGFGYTIAAVSAFNHNILDWMGSHGAAGFGLDAPTYLFTQVYASLGTSWDNYSAYRTFGMLFRQMPQVYTSTMETLVNGACQRSGTNKLACRIIPTVYATEPVPALSTHMTGKTIASWGAADWYERYTL